jgi:hypothetical protein
MSCSLSQKTSCWRSLLPLLVTGGVVLLFAWLGRAGDIEQEPILYSKTPPHNVVSQLQEQLATGKTKFQYDPDFGYLKDLLKELKIPLSSQLFVFSKTSLQRGRITPKTPRAIYFNDDVYVGFCLHGVVLEISVADPALGTAFYTLDQEQEEQPVLTRQTESCMVCHASSHNYGLPGHLVRSVHPDRTGEPLLASGSFRTDQTSPFAERWGGWYVTGKSGNQKHLGNQIFLGRHDPEEETNLPTQNVTDLSPFFTTGLYLSGHSDLVAHLVLQHQTNMHNRITRAALETRQALHYQADLNKALGEKPGTQFDSTKSRIQTAGDDLLKYLLFAGEAKLAEPVEGTSTFARDFTARGPKDSHGRTLREFDLKTRLFRYPCSYLIYSPSFDQLPAAVHNYVLQRLFDILTGHDQDKVFSHLSDQDRRNILAILRETKPQLPAYWR